VDQPCLTAEKGELSIKTVVPVRYYYVRIISNERQSKRVLYILIIVYFPAPRRGEFVYDIQSARAP